MNLLTVTFDRMILDSFIKKYFHLVFMDLEKDYDRVFKGFSRKPLKRKVLILHILGLSRIYV